MFVFAALGEFVVVKVLDVQYQYQINKIPKVLPMVSCSLSFIRKTTKFTKPNRELVLWKKVNVQQLRIGKEVL